MADYEYDGLRQTILKDPNAPLNRLETYVKHAKLLEDIKRYEGHDVAAIYAPEKRDFTKDNSYKNLLMVRGKLLGAIANELQFAGAEGGKTTTGADYKGTSWTLFMDNLVDVVPFDVYMKNIDPFKNNNPLALFAFSTMYDISMGEILASDPIGAHNALVQANIAYKNDLKQGVTIPLKLVGIKYPTIDENVKMGR
ncbi:MAG: hypothetical protein ACP5NW_02300 [Candidatus Woesearchaeota archaeon]